MTLALSMATLLTSIMGFGVEMLMELLKSKNEA